MFKISPKPLTVSLHSIKCLDETNELGSDEPYVLVTAADLTSLNPAVEVTSYGYFGDVDTGETRTTLPIPLGLDPEFIDALKNIAILRIPFWGIDNETPTIIRSPEDVIFVVSLIEKDNGSVSAARTLVKTAAVASVAASSGLSHAERTQKLVADIEGATHVPTGGPNFDDPIGTKALPVTVTDLLMPIVGTHRKNLYFYGGGGHYRLRFEFVAHS